MVQNNIINEGFLKKMVQNIIISEGDLYYHMKTQARSCVNELSNN